MEPPLSIPYNLKWRTIAFVGVFFAICAAFYGYKAIHNEAGLIINDIITLDSTSVTVFYWVFFAISAGVGLMLAGRRLMRPTNLEFGTDALLLPHGFFQSKTNRIAYSDIQAILETELGRQRFLHIHTAAQKFAIVDSLLPNADSFKVIKDFLIAHAPR